MIIQGIFHVLLLNVKKIILLYFVKSSECGLLHIYIDNLMLNVMDEKKKSNLIKSMKQNIVRFFGFGKK